MCRQAHTTTARTVRMPGWEKLEAMKEMLNNQAQVRLAIVGAILFVAIIGDIIWWYRTLRRHRRETADLERTLDAVREDKKNYKSALLKSEELRREVIDLSIKYRTELTELTARNHVLEGQLKAAREEVQRFKLRKLAMDMSIRDDKDGAITVMDAGLYYKFLTGRAVAPADDQPVPISPAGTDSH